MTPEEENEQKEILSVAHHDFEKGLNRHAFFKIHDHSIGEDLVQDTFMKTWKYFVRGGKIEMMKAFLYHVLNNLIVDQYRKNKTSSYDALLEKMPSRYFLIRKMLEMLWTEKMLCCSSSNCRKNTEK